MKFTWFIGLILLISGVAYGQGIRGYVYTSEQQPLPFTTIYVQQLETGTTTNQEGFYEVKLASGQYDLVFQYLGYETVVRSVTIADDFVELDVTLPERVVQLQEVEVRAGQEDPAYTIMRKAIAKSKFHRLQVQRYSARVYVKGAGRVKDVPWLLERRMKKEGVDSSTVFLSESVSEVAFEQPNTVRERVISIRSVGEGNDTSPTPFVNGSFYQPRVAQAVSPLSPRAFAYYRFHYEGSFEDQGRTVNKIRVIPRSRGDNVFNGYLYLLEDQWSIHSLQLFTYKQGFKINVRQIYRPIEGAVWLPVTHRIEADGSVLGFDLEYKYLATVSDYAITLNPDLATDFEIVDETTDQELAEALAQEAQVAQRADSLTLSTGDSVLSPPRYTRKQLRRRLRSYEKELERQADSPEVVSRFDLTVDSLAYDNDSAYWADIRPVPLNPREQRGYQKMDSLAVQAEEKEEGQRRRGPLGSLLFGTTVALGQNSTFTYRSLLSETHFNPVEGWHFNVPLVYRTELDSTRRLEVSAVPRYSFAREKLIGQGAVDWTYPAQGLTGRLGVAGGRFVRQFNERDPISPTLNTVTALLNKRNYIKLYEKDYLRLAYEQPVTAQLSVSATLEGANRRPLFNRSDYSWSREDADFAPNTPANVEQADTGFPAHRAVWSELTFNYEPGLKYRLYNGKKRRIAGSAPRFHFTYRGDLPVAGNDISYDLVELGVRHRWDIGVRGQLDYKLYAGSFLSTLPRYFMDFRHFPGNQVAVQVSDPVSSFRLLDIYRYSTQDRYAVAHLHYQFRKFLLTRIFEVQLLGLKENLLLNHLKTPTSPHYTEVGYSLDNIFRFLRIEAVASFHNGTYQDFGIRIGLSTSLANAVEF